MQSILGHLAAVIVFVIVAGVLFQVRQRSQLQTAEQAISYGATARAIDLARLIEHDIDNMLDATVALQPAACMADEHGVTTTFRFPTQDPLTLEEVTVYYALTDTGQQITSGARDFRLYRYDRHVELLDGTSATTSGVSLLAGFDVVFVAASGAATPCTQTGTLQPAPPDLDAIRIRFNAATENFSRLAHDQAPSDRLLLRPYGHTFRPANLHRSN